MRQWKLSLRPFDFLFFSNVFCSFSPYAGGWVSVCVRVCWHESPCAMRSWINTLVPDWQASSSYLRISQAKQANVENIISHTHIHTHVYKLSQTHWHRNRHILFVLSYQYRHNTKQGQMQLFAQSTPTSTANSAKKEGKKQKQQNEACSTGSHARNCSFLDHIKISP